MSSGWGIHVAELPGHDISKTSGTTGAAGVIASGNVSVPNSASPANYVTAWTVGGQYPWDIAPGVVTVVSDSANDAAAGSGANALLVRGVDASGAGIEEIVPMAGATPVQTALAFAVVNSAVVASAGATQSNEGNISLTIGGTDVSEVVAHLGGSHQAIFRVPNQWRVGAVLSHAYVACFERQATAVQAVVKVRVPGGAWVTAGIIGAHSYSSGISVSSDSPPVLPPGTDIEMSFVDTTRNGATAVGVFELVQL